MRNSTTTTTTRAGRGTAAGRKIIASLTEVVEAAERGETSPPGSFVAPTSSFPTNPACTRPS